MAEIINKYYSKAIKEHALIAIKYYINAANMKNQFSNNHIRYLTYFGIFIHSHQNRFPELLIQQMENNIPYQDISFVTKDNIITYFKKL